MTTRFSHAISFIGSLIVLLFLLAGCGTTVTIVQTPTFTVPPATAAPVPGVCNAADFPTQLPGGPNSSFQYPPLTYHSAPSNGAGHSVSAICSSGDPTSILTFLKQSIPAGGWTIKTTTATTLNAVQTNAPQGGFCASVDITVGDQAAYPGEWGADFHPPAAPC